MREFNLLSSAYIRHTPIERICQRILAQIIFRDKPFFYQFAPTCFRNIQMRAVWRRERQRRNFLLLYPKNYFTTRPEWICKPEIPCAYSYIFWLKGTQLKQWLAPCLKPAVNSSCTRMSKPVILLVPWGKDAK